MADIIKKTTNKFAKGLVMDFSPENTKADVLTHALNATLLTFNGNELSLQNDMGNARVETAFLPEGYIPVGTCEYGGIIYIVSYNPLEDKSQIGCFPSPERNISSEELGIANQSISDSNFVSTEGGIINTSYCVTLRSDSLNPGDKFIISANDSIYNEKIQDLFVKSDNKYSPVSNPVISLNVVSIEDSGKIIYLNSSLRDYESTDGSYKYHIAGFKTDTSKLTNIDIDSYRNVLSSGYNVFRSKTSGKLAILAELVTIDDYSVTHSIVSKEGEEGTFEVVIHTEVGPTLSEDNYDVTPKLKYYYLQHSQGYLQHSSGTTALFDSENKISSTFLNTPLSSIYASSGNSTLGDYKIKSGKFNFPKANTYHGNPQPYDGDLSQLEINKVYTKFSANKYHRVRVSQFDRGKNKTNSKKANYFYGDLNVAVYRYDPTNSDYKQVEKDAILDDRIQYYTQTSGTKYTKISKTDTKYKSHTLYKLERSLRVATTSVKEDTNIEKYRSIVEIHYTQADAEDKGPYYTKTTVEGADIYEKHDTWPEGVDTVYISNQVTELELVGTVLDESTKKETLYYYLDTFDYKIATQAEKDLFFSSTPNELILHIKEDNFEYLPASEEVLVTYKETNTTLYYKNDYVPVGIDSLIGQTASLEDDVVVYVVTPFDAYVSYDMFVPNPQDNYIQGSLTIPSDDTYPLRDPLSLYTISDFLPVGNEYQDVCLASIHIPPVITYKNLPDLPFKYDYTVVPCMNYGRLDKLAVSNTVDFSNLRNFEKSNFTVWKYHIDGNQLSLTFGAEVYDTFETDKVDGLILEFYDFRGFVGSLEINNKKSYSGTFTKLIQLNSLGALSNKRYINGEEISGYKHSIQITKDATGYFKFNNTTVSFDKEVGWVGLADSDNDCGVLYSNLLYGVKTYLRVPKTDKVEYIPKKEFFLYTSPILNDYYYTVSDFSTIHNPKLDMVLTYKLEDQGSNIPYTNAENNIAKGYYTPKQDPDSDPDSNKTLTSNINEYLAGNFPQQFLDAVKYYQYKGISRLYLEVGLKKEYEEIGLSCDPEINRSFSCTLALVGESANTALSINSNISSEYDYLKLSYKSDEFKTFPTNSIKFGKTNKTTYEISKQYFRDYNFINSAYQIPSFIDISYDFVVGHNIHIQDIKTTTVPATTVCALCHKVGSIYNYEDFNIYIKNDGDEKFYSEAMFYNAGDTTLYKFGMCRQVATQGTLTDVCFAYDTVEDTPTVITTKGRFNSGEPLKQMLPNVGKLSIGQPHAHGYGGKTNIYPKGNDYYLATKLNTTASSPALFNFVANTKDSIKYSSEFISVIPHKLNDAGQRLYTGLDSSQLESYNEALITTMKSVYAYNPDYSTFNIRKGDINIEDNQVRFVSNLISTDAKFDLEDRIFNDFIYLYGMSFSQYLEDMTTHSDIQTSINSQPYPQVSFQPSYIYCGGNGSTYLISSITYTIPTPFDISEELQFQNKDMVVVKHHDGTQSIVKGEIDKKRLYGFDFDYNHLVQLDVSNYQIDGDGNLTLLKDAFKKDEYLMVNMGSSYAALNVDSNLYSTSSGLYAAQAWPLPYGTLKQFNQAFQFTGDNTGTSSGTLSATLSLNDATNCIVKKDPESDSYFILAQNPPIPKVLQLILKLGFGKNYDVTYNQNDYEHTLFPALGVNIKRVKFPDAYISNNPDLNKLSVAELRSLLSSEENVVLEGQSYTKDDVQEEYLWANYKDSAQSSIILGAYNTLYEVIIDHLMCQIQRTSLLQHRTEDIISSDITSDYGSYSYFEYVVDENYKNRCLVNTSITLNDLEYDPTIEGHRLYMKDNMYKCGSNAYAEDSYNAIYYRTTGIGNDKERSINCLQIYTGPCFDITTRKR